MRWQLIVVAEDDEGHDSIKLTLPSETSQCFQIEHHDTYYYVETHPTGILAPNPITESKPKPEPEPE